MCAGERLLKILKFLYKKISGRYLGLDDYYESQTAMSFTSQRLYQALYRMIYLPQQNLSLYERLSHSTSFAIPFEITFGPRLTRQGRTKVENVVGEDRRRKQEEEDETRHIVPSRNPEVCTIIFQRLSDGDPLCRRETKSLSLSLSLARSISRGFRGTKRTGGRQEGKHARERALSKHAVSSVIDLVLRFARPLSSARTQAGGEVLSLLWETKG